MEGNQYLHITISKHIIIENSLGIAIYGHTYNIMHTILVGKIYYTLLDEGPFYGPFLVQDTCMPPTPPPYTYCCIFINRCSAAPYMYTLFQGHVTKSFNHMSDTLAGISVGRTCNVMLY